MIVLILFLTIVFSILGCSQLKSNQQSKPKKNEKKLVPNDLVAVNDKIEEVVDQLEKIKNKKEEKKKVKQKQEQKQAQGAQKQEKQQQGGKQGGQQNQSLAENVKGVTQDQFEKLWSKTDDLTQQLNKRWNNFEVTAQEDKAKPKDIKRFKDDLNQATEAVKKKKLRESLVNTNRLNLDLVPFFKLYKTKMPIELRAMRFYAQEILFLKGDWKKRKEDITQAKALLEPLKKKIKKEKIPKKKFLKLKNSILDLKEVIEKKKEELVKVKGRIMLENVGNLQQ